MVCAQPHHNTEQLSFETLDRLTRAMTARFTHGVSPHAQYAAWFDWASHLSRAPGRQLELWLQAVRAATRLALFVSRSAVGPANPPFVPAESDRRFDDPSLEIATLRALAAGFPRPGGMVAQRDARSPRHGAKKCRARRFHGPANPRHDVTVKRSLAQSGDCRANSARGRRQPRARRG